MLCKLAWGNVRRAGKDYLVYLLTLAVTVFYAFNTISVQVDYAGIEEEGMADLLGGMMGGLTVFLALVMGFLMVYANNFIMKRRKKEFGLYQVLGMARGQVARIMALETAIVSLAAAVLGTACGVGLSQVMVFFTASLFKTQIADFRFFFSASALATTLLCLLAIFAVTLLFNLRVVARAKIIDLMSADRRNETVKTRNAWLSAAVFVVGAVAIGVAYARLLHDGLPVDGTTEGLQQFCITTVIVVVGTVLFFFGFSGFLLKVLQSARGLYWRGLNMFTLRQLSAKVNTVSFSMAVIALVLFLAITAVTGGMSIAGMMSANLDNTTPADYSRLLVYYSEPTAAQMQQKYGNAEGTRYGVAMSPVDVAEASDTDQMLDENREPNGTAFDLESVIGSSVQVDLYDSRPIGATEPLVSYAGLSELVGSEMPKGMDGSGVTSTGLSVMSESNYNRYLAFRGKDPIDLGANGYTITCDMGSSLTNLYDTVLSQGVALDLDGIVLTPVQDKVDGAASAFSNGQGSNTGAVVVPDAVLEALNLPVYTSSLLVNYKDGISTEEGDAYVNEPRSYSPVTQDGTVVGFWGNEATRAEIFESSNNFNGLISYLAIYIGFVLVVACAAILAIQQLSGVADSGRNCRILFELGCPRRQILHSVMAQQAVFFLFPLLMGIAHALVALKVVVDLVQLFGGLDIASMVGMVSVIFLLAYGGYFLVTYLMSKGIVTDAIRVRHGA